MQPCKIKIYTVPCKSTGSQSGQLGLICLSCRFWWGFCNLAESHDASLITYKILQSSHKIHWLPYIHLQTCLIKRQKNACLTVLSSYPHKSVGPVGKVRDPLKVLVVHLRLVEWCFPHRVTSSWLRKGDALKQSTRRLSKKWQEVSLVINEGCLQVKGSWNPSLLRLQYIGIVAMSHKQIIKGSLQDTSELRTVEKRYRSEVEENRCGLAEMWKRTDVD